MVSRLGMLAVVVPGLLSAQALSEYAVGTARAAASAASVQKLSKSAGKILQNSGGTVRSTAPSTAPARRSRAAVARKAVPATARVPVSEAAEEVAPNAILEDPSRIEKGMAYREVIRRFGPPPMKLTTGPGQETLCYTSNGRAIDVQVRDGTVAAIDGTAR